MTTLTLGDRLWYHLTAHFFRGLFDFGVLSDAGSDAFRRVLIGIVAVTLSGGLLLTRVYLDKYTALSAMFTTREPYRHAVLADTALVIAFPMLVVGIVVVLVSHALFPDERDCRVLLPLPISRRVIFASKALAVMLFMVLFGVAAQVAMMPLVVLMSNSRWADDGLLDRLVAYGLASFGASLFTALAIMGITGALRVIVPASRSPGSSLAVRGSALFALVLAIPLVGRLPTMGASLANESPLFYLVPPAWFLGVEQLLLGNGTSYLLQLAEIAGVASAGSLAVSVGSYLYLYRRLERVIGRPVSARGSERPQRTWFLRTLRRRRPGRSAIAPFIRATLTRSPLHQGVVTFIAACGAGLVLNVLLGISGVRALSNADESVRAAVVWAPFALVFAMNVALRAALVLPIELPANWIFRVTEDEATRAEELSAVVRTFVLLGVVVPLVLLFPVQWAVLGLRAVHCTSVAFLCGLVLVELQMAEWRRIPFTCSYAPSRQFVGQTMLIGFAAFLLFTTGGSRLVVYSADDSILWLAVMSILAAVVLYLRRQRLWLSRRAAFDFEQILPNEVEPLRLSEY